MVKLTFTKCKRGSFLGVQNTIHLIIYNNKIFITYQLQKYIVKLYHTYLLHPGMDRTESMIFLHLQCPVIREAIWK